MLHVAAIHYLGEKLKDDHPDCIVGNTLFMELSYMGSRLAAGV